MTRRETRAGLAPAPVPVRRPLPGETVIDRRALAEALAVLRRGVES